MKEVHYLNGKHIYVCCKKKINVQQRYSQRAQPVITSCQRAKVHTSMLEACTKCQRQLTVPLGVSNVVCGYFSQGEGSPTGTFSCQQGALALRQFLPSLPSPHYSPHFPVPSSSITCNIVNEESCLLGQDCCFEYDLG